MRPKGREAKLAYLLCFVTPHPTSLQHLPEFPLDLDVQMSGYARLFSIFGQGSYLRGLKLEGASSGCRPVGLRGGPGLPGTRGEEGPTAGLRTPAPGNVSLAPESLSRSCQQTPPSSPCQMWVTGPLLTRVQWGGPDCLPAPGTALEPSHSEECGQGITWELSRAGRRG